MRARRMEARWDHSAMVRALEIMARQEIGAVPISSTGAWFRLGQRRESTTVPFPEPQQQGRRRRR